MTTTNLTVHEKARKALQIIKQHPPTLLATRPNLYKRCLDGVGTFEALRSRVTPTELGSYCSLAGQQLAQTLATASLDNVLTVLIDETTDHKWACHVVTDIPGLVFGSPGCEGYATREEAEQAIIAALGQFGQVAKPAEGYEPVPDPDTKRQIRVNGNIDIVCDSLIGILRREIIAKADAVERLLDDIVVAWENEMAGVGGDIAFGHWLFMLNARLVEDADLAFGVWPDASQPDGVGMFVIKGRELMAGRPGTSIPVIWTAIPCIHMEYAVALRDLVGDRLQ
jgi:hypothetical protein